MSINRWIGQKKTIHTIGYYLATKEKKIMPFAEAWMELEITIQSETRRKEEDKYI